MDSQRVRELLEKHGRYPFDKVAIAQNVMVGAAMLCVIAILSEFIIRRREGCKL